MIGLQVVITNAVITPKGYEVGEDGHELQFTVDHLSHFLLIKSIFPLILKARSDAFSPRIVPISSITHQEHAVPFDDLTWSNGKDYQMIAGYAAAKSANLLFTRELAKRTEGKGILAFTLDPGGKYESPYPEVIAQ